MARNQQPPSSNLQTYGFPIYAADWIPEETVITKISKDQNDDDDGSSSSSSSYRYIVLSGGGGKGRSGIPNVILICRVDLHTNSLLEQPMCRLMLGTDLPYRMAVHPRQDGLICAFPNSCRLFDWENIIDENQDGEVIKELRDVGQQLSLAFNQDGSVLATGADDGTLRVFQWPTMTTLLNESQAHESVKSLTFSESGKFLVSLGTPLCRVWDVNASAAIATLSKEKDEMFAFCRFSVESSGREVLYVAANTERGGSIITWDTASWRRRRSKLIKRNNTITAFNVSADGKLLAIGTHEGDILIIDSTKMQINQVVKKAHLGLVTALTFSPDSRCLVSVSMDSRARLTMIEQKGEKRRITLWVTVLLLVLMFSYYFMVAMGIIHT